MEIISGVERRRRWGLDDKLRIIAEVEAPGAIFAAVARRHDISRGQLWNWRRQFRSGEFNGVHEHAPEFLPVCVSPEQAVGVGIVSSVPDRPPPAGRPDRKASGRMEITFANGATVRVEGMVDATLLKAAIAAARG